MHPLLPTLLELGDAVSHNLDFAYRDDTRISFGEETITETNLLTLQRKHTDYIKIQTFSKATEVENGSDWEWVFIGTSYTYRMRIQAKRIDKNGKLKGLHRKSKTAALPQMDALIAGATSEGIKPVYCFYCTDKHRTRWKAPTDEFQPGCLIADARKVKKLKRQQFQDVEQISVPWHFLFSEKRFEKGQIDRIWLYEDIIEPVWFARSSSDFTMTPHSVDREAIRSEEMQIFSFRGQRIGDILNQEDVSDDSDVALPEGLVRTNQNTIDRAIRSERPPETAPQGIIIIDLRDVKARR